LAQFIPAIDEQTGGISSPVISPSAADYGAVLSGLLLLGVKRIKQQGYNACILDYVDGDGNFDGLTAMGFSLGHGFDEGTERQIRTTIHQIAG
jgi:beta-N-acetylhexosaminidase